MSRFEPLYTWQSYERPQPVCGRCKTPIVPPPPRAGQLPSMIRCAPCAVAHPVRPTPSASP